SQLNQELDRIGSTTSFGKQKLLDGTFGATQQTGTGTTVAAIGGQAAGAGTQLTGAWAFNLTQVAGQTLGSAITVNIKAGDIAAGSTPQDVAKVVNSAISTALKQNGFQGNEVTMTARTDSSNVTTFSMSGAGAFAITDTNNVLTGAADTTTTPALGNIKGLGINLTAGTLVATGGS
ncbi:flagellin, partial [Actinoplanes sp. KI2]|nr:flagellin [Actinoplanes sp. KI2]